MAKCSRCGVSLDVGESYYCSQVESCWKRLAEQLETALRELCDVCGEVKNHLPTYPINIRRYQWQSGAYGGETIAATTPKEWLEKAIAAASKLLKKEG